MRMMFGLALLAALVGASQPSLAGTIIVSGYEYLSRPIEETSYVQSVGGIELSSGGPISLGSRGNSTAAVPLLGGDIHVAIDQSIVGATGAFEGVVATSIPESDPDPYTMLQTGLWLMSTLVYGQRDGIDATSSVAEASSPYTASTRRRLKGPDVFFSSSAHDVGRPLQQLTTTVPEPSSIVLVAIGLLALFTRRSRKGHPRPRFTLGLSHPDYDV